MSGYEVDIAELRSAAAAARSAGEQCGRMDVGAALSGVADALPGAVSAPVVSRLATRWSADGRTWSTRMSSHGDRVAAAAEDYAVNEAAAEEAFHPRAARTGRGPF